MSLLDRLRYRWLGLTKGMAFPARVKDLAVRQLIGHNRIIGWEEGLPVRSLTIPAEYSNASALMMARLYNNLRPARQYPGLASLSLTNRCDCTCPHCFAAGQEGTDLSTATWCRVIREALDLGAFTVVINGGEPLLREDLPEILRAVDQDQATCLLYTNGALLAERAGELHAAGLRRVAVAIDFADAERHDQHRGRPGIYQRALAGLAAAQERGMLVALSTFASTERLEDGTLQAIFDLALELGVNEIMVYDLLPAGRLHDADAIRAAVPEFRQRFRQFVQPWWDRADGPGIWWYGQVTKATNLGCPGGTTMLNISHTGEVRPCDFCRTTVGSVVNESLDSLWWKLNAAARQRMGCSPSCLVLAKEQEE